MINIQHVTHKDMMLGTKPCMIIGRKVGLALKGHNLIECNKLNLQKGSSQTGIIISKPPGCTGNELTTDIHIGASGQDIKNT